MAFDECPDPNRPREYQHIAVQRTIRWAEECKQSHARPRDQALFGIVQGGVDQALRMHCAERLIAMDFPGYAIGGLAVGEGFEAMLSVLRWVTPTLPGDKPRYLMGVGYPRDIVEAVANGVDMFDCVLPTRNGRNAYAFTKEGAIRLRNSRFTCDNGPIEADCDCYACRHFSRGSIRHFFFAGEMLGPILVSVHNIRFYQRLMADIRQAIGRGEFEIFRRTDSRCSLGPSAGDATDIEQERDTA
ncbi:MAG TPA: tRNA guanosine(34) transglycosylase Tgt, partial [Tepidisphaeraceae bacterium]|nr:tRNA guanosine(34) transglycosylase Tgt [Tepidisphaeraceae bacterium]